jgi:glycosyltransferase involved in cell wall biosynthesis
MFISVVMAVYNGERYLQSAINSILGQTYKTFELIIVNDGSIDQTKEILDTISDTRVKIIHLMKNGGAANALNIGVENAKGKWIAIHDADDISEPTRLEEQVDYLLSHPESIGIGSLIKCFFGNTHVRETMIHNEEEYYNKLFDDQKVYDNRLCTCYLCHGSVIFSKDLFSKIGGYNPKYKICYDYDLWLRMFDNKVIQKLPSKLYNYRITTDSLGKSSTDQTCYELQTIVTDYIYQTLKSTLKREPVFVVVGTKKGCQLFKETIQVEQNLNVTDYFYYRRKKKSLEQMIHNQVDAILLLNDKYSNRVLKSLLRMGLSLNENVFVIWNYRYTRDYMNI